MTLLLALDTARFPDEYCSQVVHVFHEFFKCATIPAVDTKLYAHANMFGIINGLGAFQYEQLKEDHPLGVPLLSLYTIKIH